MLWYVELGPVCLKGVEAYVVKDMEANLIVGEDTQLTWQLHTIWEEGRRHWKVSNSLHCIPTFPGPMPTETFTASWAPTSPDAPPIKAIAKKLIDRNVPDGMQVLFDSLLFYQKQLQLSQQ